MRRGSILEQKKPENEKVVDDVVSNEIEVEVAVETETAHFGKVHPEAGKSYENVTMQRVVQKLWV